MSAKATRPKKAATKTKKSTDRYELPKELKKLKVAIVHDWLIGGGAELVVEQLHEMFPYAPIYTSYATKEWKRRLHGMVETGTLQHWPFSRMRKFLPLLRIWWFSRLKLEGYDLVISSSGAEAKGVRVPEGTVHINYCHAPTHYYWSRYDEYMRQPGFGLFDPLARIGLRVLVAPLRKWDYAAAQRPDFMIANSTHTRDEIQKYYGRKADVVFPPVDTDRFKPERDQERFGFVITGRQTPYKRFDLAIEACNRAKAQLKVIGNGPDHNRLTAMAGPTIRFLGRVSDEELTHHLQIAEGYIFAGTDDFGIAAVEAQAAGTPVVAYKSGGALDYIKPGVTGEFFDKPTPESLAKVLRKFDPDTYDHKKIIRATKKYSVEQFRGKMEKVLVKKIERIGQSKKK